MDYVVGSVAALISGNVTPNRPKLVRRALTPIKHQASPNVTPKSEFVEDRSIFLSPTLQKKKAIVKKSPKRIFQNPDLDVTNDSEGESKVTSPNADKVKKHLKDELEATDMAKISPKSPKGATAKVNKSVELGTPKKQKKICENVQVSNENTPKKKKQRNSESEQHETVKSNEKDNLTGMIIENNNTPKKNKKRKSISESSMNMETDNNQAIANNSSPKKNKKEILTLEGTILENNNTPKKNKKQKSISESSMNMETDDNQVSIANNVNKSSPKKNKKNKKSTSVIQNTETDSATKTQPTETDKPQNNQEKKKKRRKRNKKPKPQTENNLETTEKDTNSETQDTPIVNVNSKSKKVKKPNIVNPNAITNEDTDSEHESDDEIESENEQANNEILDTGPVDSSDDEEEIEKSEKKKPEKEKKEEKKERDVETEDEIKRTLFVGNVPFSKKCKKEVKKIFSKYGNIETVRIRTVPVKDARVTPKLAVIKNELHPDRSTVNVYVKFERQSSVAEALAENNTVLNEHHLRVSRSDNTGATHDPKCSVFIGNLPFAIEDEGLRAKFDKCGEILSVRIIRDRKTNAGKGFGYVNFASKDGVELALALSEEDLTIKNRILRVKRCTLTDNKQNKNRGGPVTQGGKFQPRNQGGNQGFQGRNQGGNQSFQGRNQGGNQGFQGRNQGGNQGFQGRNQGGNQGFQSRNQGGNFQGRNQGGNQGFQGRNQGGNQGGVQGKQGKGRSQGNAQRGQGFGTQNEQGEGAFRRIMKKRQIQEGVTEGPPSKIAKVTSEPKEKKARKEFVGMTAEKKKKQKPNKGNKKKRVLSEILTKNKV